MAGVKGKSGGPRRNSGGARPNAGGARLNSGGYRPGAGRKANPPLLVDDPALETTDPDAWLKAAMNSSAVPMKCRLEIAAFLRSRGMAPLEVMDALYMSALGGNVSAQISYLSAWRREQRRNRAHGHTRKG